MGAWINSIWQAEFGQIPNPRDTIPSLVMPESLIVESQIKGIVFHDAWRLLERWRWRTMGPLQSSIAWLINYKTCPTWHDDWLNLNNYHLALLLSIIKVLKEIQSMACLWTKPKLSFMFDKSCLRSFWAKINIIILYLLYQCVSVYWGL